MKIHANHCTQALPMRIVFLNMYIFCGCPDMRREPIHIFPSGMIHMNLLYRSHFVNAFTFRNLMVPISVIAPIADCND